MLATLPPAVMATSSLRRGRTAACDFLHYPSSLPWLPCTSQLATARSEATGLYRQFYKQPYSAATPSLNFICSSSRGTLSVPYTRSHPFLDRHCQQFTGGSNLLLLDFFLYERVKAGQARTTPRIAPGSSRLPCDPVTGDSAESCAHDQQHAGSRQPAAVALCRYSEHISSSLRGQVCLNVAHQSNEPMQQCNARAPGPE